MSRPLSSSTRRLLNLIAQQTSRDTQVPVPDFVRPGKLSPRGQAARDRAIQRMVQHVSRHQIAEFFGISYRKVSDVVPRHETRAFTTQEDTQILDLHCKGFSLSEIQGVLSHRSHQALRRRLSVLQGEDPAENSFPKPSYAGVPPHVLAIVKGENKRMHESQRT